MDHVGEGDASLLLELLEVGPSCREEFDVSAAQILLVLGERSSGLLWAGELCQCHACGAAAVCPDVHLAAKTNGRGEGVQGCVRSDRVRLTAFISAVCGVFLDIFCYNAA